MADDDQELEEYEEFYTEQIELKVRKTPAKFGVYHSADGISISIDGWNIWQLQTDENKEILIQDHAYWTIIERGLKYELGHGVSSPTFNSVLHKLRKMIFTDRELVGDMLASLVEALLNEIERAQEQHQEYRRAYYEAYHDEGLYPRMGELRQRRNFPPVEDLEGERQQIDRAALRENLMKFMDGLLLPASAEFDGEEDG